MSNTTHNGVRLDANHTTLDLPHKKCNIGDKTYYVATFPEGDLALHEHSPRYECGYGGMLVSFLMEDGSIETVRGPFSCGDIFDFGRSRRVSEQLGLTARQSAFRITVGRNLWMYSQGRTEVLYAEPALSCDPLGARLAAAMSGIVADDVEAKIEFRNSATFLRREQIEKAIASGVMA